MSLNLCCLPFLQPSSDVYVKILAGDEVIQVNGQIVVSFTVYARHVHAALLKPSSRDNQTLCHLRWVGAEPTL